MANSYNSDARGGWGIELIMTILPRNLSDAAVGEVIDLSVRPSETSRTGSRRRRHITPVKGDTSIMAPHQAGEEKRRGINKCPNSKTHVDGGP